VLGYDDGCELELSEEGIYVETSVGFKLGLWEGDDDGESLGDDEGESDGESDGWLLGEVEGEALGDFDG
jgi:hypothetical protein